MVCLCVVPIPAADSVLRFRSPKRKLLSLTWSATCEVRRRESLRQAAAGSNRRRGPGGSRRRPTTSPRRRACAGRTAGPASCCALERLRHGAALTPSCSGDRPERENPLGGSSPRPVHQQHCRQRLPTAGTGRSRRPTCGRSSTASSERRRRRTCSTSYSSPSDTIRSVSPSAWYGHCWPSGSHDEPSPRTRPSTVRAGDRRRPSSPARSTTPRSIVTRAQTKGRWWCGGGTPAD